MNDVMTNAKSFLASEGINADKLSTFESPVEENQDDNPLVWELDAQKNNIYFGWYKIW